MYNNTNST